MSSKQTKRALFSSFWALLLCFAMLLGTTFAWFTDTATTGVNKIQAGNLKIDVQYTLDGKEWADLNEASDIFKDHLWEPGHTGLVGLKIHNAGNLSLKYKISMNLVSETKGTNKAGQEFKLSDYLKVSSQTSAGQAGEVVVALAFDNSSALLWEPEASFLSENVICSDVPATVGGEDQYFVIKVKMPETVGNEANAIDAEHTPSINFGINVVATQYTGEYDSTTNQYDKDANYRSQSITNTYNGTVYDGETLSLSSQDIKHTFKNSNSMDGKAVYLKNGAALTLDDVTLNTTTENDTGKRNVGFFVYNGSSLTINSGEYIMDGQWNVLIWAQGGKNNERCTVTINGGTFIANGSIGNSTIITAYSGYGYCGSDVYITGGFFDLSKANPNVTLQWKEDDSTMTVTGGTFVNYDPAYHKVVPAGYHVESAKQADGTTWYTVVAD